MRVQLLEKCLSDIAAGMKFYNRHGRDVGAYFRDSIFFDINSLEILGGVHGIRHGYHCMPAKRFPFAIYYDVSGDLVSVVAVLDERRNPTWIEKQMKNR